MKQLRLILLLAVALVSACSTQKKTLEAPAVYIEERDLDTLFVSAEKPVELRTPDDYQLPSYNASHTRVNDLLHTRLELSFNWKEESVNGKATLKLKPHFYATDKLTLDAKGFDVHALTLANGQALTYDYNNEQLFIQLDKTYQQDEAYTLVVDYTAHPTQSGGSAAITSDQGLFFVNPQGDDGDKPQQIWTQGETEWNSHWFPTIDKPNERCTQEVLLTVQDRFVTLSNGVKINSTDNGNGTRTDHWKMDKPHAPYLFMLAIGEFAVVEDSWNGITVDYYVEPEYKEDARAIFAHTTEMLDFFSEKLQVDYPWPKYSQVVVRDYVSGAMENTTASIFGDFVQRHERELIDDNNDRIVAHELFHHWFGDFVTCESWANLTMNEGFANYSEYMWFEHKYGRDEADYHLLGEWSGYLNSANIHPLIYFGYEDKEDMFDAHSYNKGGAVLHMLRNYVGDDAFFAALNKYLTDNAFQAVEAHHLRLAFEEVSGQDLNWFFNQWYFAAGHPELNISYSYDSSATEAVVLVEQVQDPERMPAVFQLPVAIDIYVDGERQRQNVMIDQRRQELRFPVNSKPDLVNFDADRVLLAETQDNKTEEELIFQFYNAPRFLDRYEAVSKLNAKTTAAAAKVLTDALTDDFWVIRGVGIESLGEEVAESDRLTLRKLAQSDERAQVRGAALEKLAALADKEGVAIARERIEQDRAYMVVGAALQVLRNQAPEDAMIYAQKLEDTKSDAIRESISTLYLQAGDPARLGFFEKNLDKVNGYAAISFMTNYQQLAAQAEEPVMMDAMQTLYKMALDMGQSPFRRFGATNALNDMRNDLRIAANDSDNEKEKAALEEKVSQFTKMIDTIKATETNDQLKGIYRQLSLIKRA